MTTYYIVAKKGLLEGLLAAEYEGNYCEALDYAAHLLEVPDGQPVSEYADVLTPDEYAEEYGDDEETDEETDALVRRMCAFAAEVEAELYAES